MMGLVAAVWARATTAAVAQMATAATMRSLRVIMRAFVPQTEIKSSGQCEDVKRDA
jgi:hypothetical protein